MVGNAMKIIQFLKFFSDILFFFLLGYINKTRLSKELMKQLNNKKIFGLDVLNIIKYYQVVVWFFPILDFGLC